MKRKFLILFLILLVIPAFGCKLLSGSPAAADPARSNPITPTTPAADPVTEPVQPSATPKASAPAADPQDPPAETEADQPDGIDRLLMQHSIHLTMSAVDGEVMARTLTADIDADGSVHLMDETTQAASSGGAESDPAFDPTLSQSSREMYIIGGQAYLPGTLKGKPQAGGAASTDDVKTAWQVVKGAESYLADELNGPEGPGLWLSLLPDGSLTPDGTEETGGFNAEKYRVSGDVDGSTVQGTIWIDPDSRALVRAELDIPLALMVLPENSLEGMGSMQIKLEASRADIPPVKLPVED